MSLILPYPCEKLVKAVSSFVPFKGPFGGPHPGFGAGVGSLGYWTWTVRVMVMEAPGGITSFASMVPLPFVSTPT